MHEMKDVKVHFGRDFWGGSCALIGITAVVFVAFAVWMLNCVVPDSSDMIARYAPMADAFAQADWINAFHPRFCLQFPVLCGTLVWITGLPGDRACQMVALLFFCFSAIPLWILARRLTGSFVAWSSVLIYWLCPDLILHAADGWRDDCRVLSLLLVALGFLLSFTRTNPRPALGSVCLAVAQFLAITLRVDCFAIACLVLLTYCSFCVFRRQLMLVVAPISAWAVATALECQMVYYYTGWWLPAPHMIRFVEAFL